MVRFTTRERWAFAPYSLEERGEQNVPLIYLKEARWRTVQGSTGYFVNIPTRPSQYYPVEFNHTYVCWCKITWNAPRAEWNVVGPTGPNYRCDIFEDEIQTSGNVGAIDGQPPLAPRTPAPSTDSREEEEGSENSENTVESGQPGNTTEEEGLADLAESIHINPPEMATITEPPQMEERINEHMGHRVRRVVNIIDDEAALQRAAGSDRADPPSGGPERLPELPPIRLPQDDRPRRAPEGRGFPGGGGFPGGNGGFPGGNGGFPGGGGYPGGGGVPPGGPPGGGWGPPPLPIPQAHQGKLVGEPPTIYDSNRKKTTLFINEWELYWAVNNDNALMINPYR